MSNGLKTALLLGGLTALLLIIGQLVGGLNGLIIALVISVGMNFVSYFWSDKIALNMYRAKLANKKEHKELLAMVKELSQKAGIPTPKTYVIPSMNSNAFATGRNPQNASVAVTVGIMQLLNKNELKGVIAHELAHIKNRDILIASIAATIAGVISFVASMARWSAIFGGFNNDENGENIVSLLVLAILAPLMAVIIQLAISRSREFAADAGAAKIVGHGEGLARALEKLEFNNKKNPMRFGSTASASLFITNPFVGKAFVNLFSTHPSTKKRVKRLRGLYAA